ncbi:MAG: IS200/IS605 family accessory protein TnpB-related protein [Candidatus Thermoplasmatota archaeon]
MAPFDPVGPVIGPRIPDPRPGEGDRCRAEGNPEGVRGRSRDRRVQRILLNREGRRERNRVRQRLRRVSKVLVRAAKDRRAAIVLEDLKLHGAGGRSRRMNRRLSSWPRREIHR